VRSVICENHQCKKATALRCRLSCCWNDSHSGFAGSRKPEPAEKPFVIQPADDHHDRDHRHHPVRVRP
jgi:hypothetical protein